MSKGFRKNEGVRVWFRVKPKDKALLDNWADVIGVATADLIRDAVETWIHARLKDAAREEE